MHDVDLSFLELPEVLKLIFYPRRDLSVGAGVACFVDVGGEVRLGCKFYACGEGHPAILYFHGNGETAGDYDGFSWLFTDRGINLFVAEYRGYGLSGGSPTVTSLLRDAHPVFRRFKDVASEEGWDGLFVMGRSLGSIPAVELAYHYQGEVDGLIVESGVANTFTLFLDLFGVRVSGELREKLEAVSNKAKIREVRVPTLIIHAENDTLIPLDEAVELYKSSGADDKELFIIPGADHNDLWFVAGEKYYEKIRDFVERHL
ncbi:MAG: alpha/beta hydrolase [Candidatus Freyarchaeota archaeon]|nr:alpha/beta hydrolase [Candidatus Jordarchaeia archaeon]